MDVSTFSDLTAAIYDCAIDESRWPETLERLIHALHFQNASLNVLSLTDSVANLHYSAGIEPEWRAKMDDHIDDVIDMWGGRARMLSYPFDRPTILSQANPQGLTNGNRYVREWRRPQGLIDSMVLILAHDRTAIANVAFGRHHSQGRIGPEAVKQASLFLPHLQRAVQLGGMVRQAVGMRSDFLALVDALAVPVLLVDSRLAIVYANVAAEDQLRDGSNIARRDGRLIARALDAQRSLEKAFEKLRDGACLAGDGIGLPARCDGSRPSALYILPLGARQGLSASGAAAAIFVSPVIALRSRLRETVAPLFGLTAAEARVFQLIAAGNDVSAAAAATGLAISTIRTHLHSIFGKTGVKRQPELVQLAHAMASPLTPQTLSSA